MTSSWLTPTPDGFRSRTPWVWSILLGITGFAPAAVAASYAGSTESSTTVGLFALAAAVLLGTGGVLRYAVAAGRGRLRISGLRRMAACLYTGGYLTIAAVGFSIFLRLTSSSDNELSPVPLPVVAALMSTLLFFMFGSHCRRTVNALRHNADHPQPPA